MDNLQICAPRQGRGGGRDPSASDGVAGGKPQEILRRADALRDVMGGLPAWRLDAVGAYFAFVRHPFPEMTSAQVAEHLAKQAGIVCIPGGYFGPGQEQYLRFAFANADVPTILSLRERLEAVAP